MMRNIMLRNISPRKELNNVNLEKASVFLKTT